MSTLSDACEHLREQSGPAAVLPYLRTYAAGLALTASHCVTCDGDTFSEAGDPTRTCLACGEPGSTAP